MNIDFYLPKPTDDELNMNGKADYYARILNMNLDKKYKITDRELTSWIHHNYTAIYLLEEELSYTSYKKLKI